MSPRVSLSLKAARAIAIATRWPGTEWAFADLDSAIAKAQRSSATRRKLRQPKESKRSARREETIAIRATVARRADTKCEACGVAFTDYLPAELDHFWGRAREESVTACWMLCRRCHRRKTDNLPVRACWLTWFAAHCDKHGYANAAAKARRELSWVESKAVKP